MNNIVYRICRKFFLTAGIIRKIEQRVFVLYPSTKYSVIKKTQDYMIKMFFVSLILFLGLWAFSDISFYYTCIVLVIVYVVSNTYINTTLIKEELKLLLYFEEFVTEVHFRYQFEGNVLSSIETAINKVPYEMAVHGEMILNYLKNAYRGEGDDYREIAPNSLFLTFYSLSLTVLNYGDKTIESGSLYLRNLGYLKEDINIEILKRKKIQGQFMGLSKVTILPIFFIKIIEKWALANMPELSEYYYGTAGILTTIFLTVLTIAVYKLITYLRCSGGQKEYKGIYIQKLLDIGIVYAMVLKIIKLNYKKSEEINRMLKSMMYPYDIKEFVLRRIVFMAVTWAVTFVILASIGLNMILCFAGAVIFGCVTYYVYFLQIVIKRRVMIMDSEEEIVRFQSVILMLMHMDRISVYEVLCEIDKFAVIFGEEIRKMINGYSYNGMKVFEEAKENTGFLPFEKLMDNFLAVDLLGVKNAFLNMETERRYYVEKHKQETEDVIVKKAVIAKAAAFVPICLVIMLKLILPFVMEGIKQLSNTGL